MHMMNGMYSCNAFKDSEIQICFKQKRNTRHINKIELLVHQFPLGKIIQKYKVKRRCASSLVQCRHLESAPHEVS